MNTNTLVQKLWTRSERTRPWKLDWDIGISLLMAALAYLTAPWSMRVMVERQWRQLVGQMLRR